MGHVEINRLIRVLVLWGANTVTEGQASSSQYCAGQQTNRCASDHWVVCSGSSLVVCSGLWRGFCAFARFGCAFSLSWGRCACPWSVRVVDSVGVPFLFLVSAFFSLRLASFWEWVGVTALACCFAGVLVIVSLLCGCARFWSWVVFFCIRFCVVLSLCVGSSFVPFSFGFFAWFCWFLFFLVLCGISFVGSGSVSFVLALV